MNFLLVLAVILSANFLEQGKCVTIPPEWSIPTGLTWPSDWTLPPDFSFPTTLEPIFPIEEALVEAGDLGKIQGALTFTLPNSTKFYWFGGIPYADVESYTGDNRFKPSVLKTGLLSDSEDTAFNAVNPLIFCLQRDIFPKANKNDLGEVLKAYKQGRKSKKEEIPVLGTEECLVINVNTPKIPREGDGDGKLLPVIFFIHGGSFDSFWGGALGGHRFLNRDVVLVTINYRLGLLGSLNLGIDEAPGNAAMYDVIVALEWVQRYIHHFGGDKNQVTVAGHSAGSVMATHLLSSPLVKDRNLIHGVIGLSGSSVSAWATCTDPISHHLRTSKLAGCESESNNRTELAVCMREQPITVLIEALNKWEDEETVQGRLSFNAKIPSLQDPSSLTVPIYMDETPLSVFQQGKQLNVPVMLGTARHDGTFVMKSSYDDFIKPSGLLEDIPRLRNEFLFTVLAGLGMEDPTGAMVHSLAYTYLGKEAMNSNNFTDMIPGFIDIHSVLAFKAGSYNLVEMHSKLNPKSYYFSFEYSGMWTVDGSDVIPGVGHIDQVFYLFQAFPLICPNDLDVSARFVDYCVNFATYGNPNGPDGSGNEIFPSYNADTHPFLKINETDSTGYNCRASWIDNSIEIKDNLNPEMYSPCQEETTSTTSEGSSTTEGPNQSSETSTDVTGSTSQTVGPTGNTEQTGSTGSTENTTKGTAGRLKMFPIYVSILSSLLTVKIF